MNILVITATYPPSANGVAISTKRSVTELRKLGHRVVVVGPSHRVPDEPGYVRIPTVSIPSQGFNDYPIAVPFTVTNLLKKLPRIAWDVIHVHHPVVVGPYALRIGRALGVPVVFTYHTQYDQYLDHLTILPKFVSRMLYRRSVLSILPRFDGIIATTRWLRHDLSARLTHPPVFYASTAGLDRSFAASESKGTLRNMLGLTGNGPYFLSVSRLSREKRIDILLSGFVAWATANPAGYLVVVGDGSYRKKLEAYASATPVAARIRFTGKIANGDLPSWYGAADYFLYGSITDTIGINILEAMSAGLPVIAPDHVTTREIIRPGINGVLWRGQPDGMGQAIATAMRNRATLSRGALVTAGQYRIETTTADLVRIYETVSRSYRRLRG